MLPIAYYFIKVIAISGVLMLYYRLVLYNKKFHSYNRYYLLFTVVFSWLLPFIQISINQSTTKKNITPVYQFVNNIADNNMVIENIIVQSDAKSFDWSSFLILFYIIVCSLFFVAIILGLAKVIWLLKKHSCISFENIHIIFCNAKGTPFSFFKYLFWNEAITLQSETGKQILQHELVHIQQKHSIDKLLMQLVLVAGWFNPFFWWAKNELSMIHEFIADHKSVEEGKPHQLAAMLLTVSFPQQQYLFANPFFLSPIKRRLSMLTNKKNPKFSYARRIIILPILTFTILLFAFRKKEMPIAEKLNKIYTVVIDAGHGGNDMGATNNNLFEKDIALSIAKKIQANNQNKNIKIVLTRSEDAFLDVKSRVEFATKQNADLFISVHTNWAPKSQEKEGIEVYIPNDDRKGIEQCKVLANTIGTQLQSEFKFNGTITRTKGIYVLKATECPAVLVEYGYISNPKDVALMVDENKQNQFSNLVLKGIENYLSGVETTTIQKQIPTKNTNKNFVVTNATLEVNNINSYNLNNIIKFNVDSLVIDDADNINFSLDKAMFVLSNKEIKKEMAIDLLKNNEISLVRIIKDKNVATNLFEKAENGLVILQPKKPDYLNNAPLNNAIVKQGFGKYILEGSTKLVGINDGLLINSATDNSVKAVDDGFISFAGDVGDEKAVIIKNANNYYFTYANLSELSVKKGQTIEKGNIVGKAKNIPNGYELLFMLSDEKGKLINPSNVFGESR